MNGNDVLEIVNTLEQAGIDVWLDGGWGIDALVGKQTRKHTDLDVVVALDKVEHIKNVLGSKGFIVSEDELPTRFVLQDASSRHIDFHTVTFDSEGGGMQKLQDRRSYRYPPQGFTGKGSINGLVVKCLTPEVQAECHYGYEPDENDRHDMQLLQDYFGIKLKRPYMPKQESSSG
jgi:lincosamide nucleotidyltransferase A/C/D/E